MKRIIILLISFCTLSSVLAQSSKYRVAINLNDTDNDQIPVTVYPPESISASIEYHIAKVVPGTYDISDFGRFVTDFAALNADGDTLDIERLSTNRWKIDNKSRVHKITYRVHDTWDEFEGYDDNIVFEPGGTNINAEKQAFVLNTFGFIGYVKGKKFVPYEVEITHPEEIYGATALIKEEKSPTEDIYFADDFNFLADGPIMYCEPDTVTRKIANAEVLVAVFSPNRMLSASEVMENIDDLMQAQTEYLGGELPVDRYAYLIYLNENYTLSGSMGALEHSYSSVYSLPEAGADRLAQTVRDVAAHEFFHILTPLNIHSEEIGKFDYIDPEMSKHLWLYEGVTEYSSLHVQVKYNLFGPEAFLNQIREKIAYADQFPKNVPFTVMSENILDSAYNDMFTNVYNKGALIAMCLDINLIKLSNGEKDLQWLMRELAKKYGKEKSFKDDELFDVIEGLTYPEIGEFLRTYVAGESPLPLAETLDLAGVNYFPEKETREISFGNVGLNINENMEIYYDNLSEANSFIEDLGVQEGDVILEIEGEEVALSNFQEVLSGFKASTEEGDKVKILVRREVKGKEKEVKLKAKAIKVETKEKYVVELNPNPTEEQVKVLQAWIVAKK